MMERKLLTKDETTVALEQLNGWQVEGVSLALGFVNRVGILAEELDHHPDTTFGWGYAEILTTTHDRGGITQFDTELAARIDAIAD